MFQNLSWVEQNFQRRECVQFVRCPKDNMRLVHSDNCLYKIQDTFENIKLARPPFLAKPRLNPFLLMFAATSITHAGIV